VVKRRALISVSDKTGIDAFAAKLVELGYEIISTGGTKSLLERLNIPVTGISDVTGFPEILDGRVKTLHPAVHSGLLAVRSEAEHRHQMEQLQLDYIDLVAVNLYPFQQTIAKPNVSTEEAIENIDIGGPSMLRSAAKNHAFVTVVVDATDYAQVLEQIETQGDTTLATRRMLAAKTFRHTAAYDALIGEYLTAKLGVTLPERITVSYEKVQDLRYGENPHQQAAFYKLPLAGAGSLANAEQLHGKELSYNNINDANAALHILREFTDEPAAVAVKHMNPCGVGIGKTIAAAFQKAYEADPTSIFGGIVALNRPVDAATAEQLHDIFLEIVIAPDYDPQALTILTKKKNIRLLKLPFKPTDSKFLLTSVEGGMLYQEADTRQLDTSDLNVVTTRAPSTEEMKQLLFAWKVVKHVKSNAIALARDDRTVGIGAGQMNRVGSARIALEQAGAQAKQAVLASDAFFPMGDTVLLAAQYGITAIIQPGGSIKDEDSIAAANAHGIAMVFTGVRHFRH
jgi:phosphoribosylaminoimidazolecarboxamide formyltransferase/IMP cyclohydrolase